MHAKTALITGASAGIGNALAHEFAKDNWNLVLVARREEALEALADELGQRWQCQTQVVPCDLAKPGAARTLMDEIRSRNLEIDCLVNNAGRGHFGPFLEQDWEVNEETIALNVVTLTSLTHMFLKEMVERDFGYILNIASIAAFMPGPNLAVYHATKAYVLSLSEALSAELSGTGVSVTASCPGPTESEFFEKSGSTGVRALQLSPIMRAEVVAAEAYSAMLSGKSTKVHGVIGKLVAQSPRLLPKAWVAPLVKRLTS